MIAFKFNCSKIHLKLTYNRNAHINKEVFNDIGKTFSRSTSFFINIEVSEEDPQFQIISKNVCLEFIVIVFKIINFP